MSAHDNAQSRPVQPPPEQNADDGYEGDFPRYGQYGLREPQDPAGQAPREPGPGDGGERKPRTGQAPQAGEPQPKP